MKSPAGLILEVAYLGFIRSTGTLAVVDKERNVGCPLELTIKSELVSKCP